MPAALGAVLLAVSAACGTDAPSIATASPCAQYVHTWKNANETVRISQDRSDYLIEARNGDGSVRGTYVATCANGKLGGLPSTMGGIALIRGGTAIAWAGEELARATDVVLRLRPVVAAQPTTGSPVGAPPTDGVIPAPTAPPVAQQQAAAQLAALTCGTATEPARLDRPQDYVAACSQDNSTKYLLGPVIVDGTDVADAGASRQQTTGEWVVLLSFTSAAQSTWAQYTGAHIGDQIAVTVNGRVLSAPRINGAITGPTQITGSFTEASARKFAKQLGGS